MVTNKLELGKIISLRVFATEICRKLAPLITKISQTKVLFVSVCGCHVKNVGTAGHGGVCWRVGGGGRKRRLTHPLSSNNVLRQSHSDL